MFSYNIAKTADPKAFENACALIEAGIKKLSKEELLEDVDGTQIQIYTTPEGKIKVFNDYEVDAVYADSDFDLEREIRLGFFNRRKELLTVVKVEMNKNDKRAIQEQSRCDWRNV